MTTLQTLIPVLVPVLLAVGKLFVPKIPRLWLPILAPILGAAIELLTSGALTTNTAWAAVLGSAGVGLREIVDQMRKAIAPPAV